MIEKRGTPANSAAAKPAARDYYRCVVCRQLRLARQATLWQCAECGQAYPVLDGIPALYLEERVGGHDRELRDRLYNGLLGRHYQQLMPLLTLPVRPWRLAWKGWVVFGAVVAMLVAAGGLLVLLAFNGFAKPNGLHALAAAGLVVAGVMAARHPYFLYLVVLAVPVRVATLLRPYHPVLTFNAIHAELIASLRAKRGLRILDTCSGTGDSLLRHGWTSLDASFVALDLSSTMLRRARDRNAEAKLPIEFVLANCADLPFDSDSFDVVLSYGGFNGFTDPGSALREMTRVVRPGGLLVIYDEQLDEGASWVERVYFRRVCSPHDTIDRFPVSAVPDSLDLVRVHQVYRYYYLCVARKRDALDTSGRTVDAGAHAETWSRQALRVA